MSNLYFNKSIDFKNKIIKSVKSIFSNFNNELILKIENLNLLERNDNCIQSSTAIGFCLEEFTVNFLLKETQKENDFKILRNSDRRNQNFSYDFYSKFKNDLFLINIKVDKENNNAISAINQLYNDYVKEEPNKEKHFFILKIHYSILNCRIKINEIDGYFLEEIDFSKGYNSDSRNWSERFNNNSGRLQISNNFYNNHRLPINEISYNKTKHFIELIYSGEIKKIEKNKK